MTDTKNSPQPFNPADHGMAWDWNSVKQADKKEKENALRQSFFASKEKITDNKHLVIFL